MSGRLTTQFLNAHTVHLGKFNKGYTINQFNKCSKEEATSFFTKIISDHHMKDDKRWLHIHPRLWELKKPTVEFKAYKRELGRQRDRSQIAYMCRYIMFRKQMHMPRR